MAVQEMDLGFDPDELREKYRVERDKRLRVDGSEQYQEMEGDYTHYVDDPYIKEKIEREAAKKVKQEERDAAKKEKE